MDQFADLYAVLGVDRLATPEEIRAAHDELTASDAGGRPQVALAESRADIDAAYAILSDPQKRRDYDRNRALAIHAATGPRVPTDAECMFCASSPVHEATFHRQVGLLFVRRRAKRTVRACRDCGRHVGRTMQNLTLWQGWWGLISLFTNVGTVIGNATHLRRFHRLEAPRAGEDRIERPLLTPMDPGRTIFLRSGMVGIVVAAVAASFVITSDFHLTGGGANRPASAFNYQVGDCVLQTSSQHIDGTTSCTSADSGGVILAIVPTLAQCPEATQTYFTESAVYDTHKGWFVCLS